MLHFILGRVDGGGQARRVLRRRAKLPTLAAKLIGHAVAGYFFTL